MFDIRRLFQITLVVYVTLACLPHVEAQELNTPSVSDALQDSVDSEELQNAFPTQYGNFAAKPFLRPVPRIYFITLPSEQVYVERKDNGSFYSETRIGGVRSGVPSVYSSDEYYQLREELAKEENWKMLIREARQREGTGRGLLDFSLQIPGGQESAFTTIFGKPEVNLRVNGVAQMNVGASVQKSEDPSLPPDQQTRVDPTFDQNLQLNIQGTIGDKLTIQTDWDTERTLDYQNTLNIVYEGYEDEIIKSIEMGNVSLNTGNSLVRGSGALFGIKSVAELGSLRLTSVVSQQDGESNVETISGGSQERQIEIRPAEYSDDQHFFMDFYTRQQFESSMANPQQLSQTLQIADVELWVLRENIQAEEGSKLAVALADIGVNQQSNGSYGPPDNRSDAFSDQLLDQYRDPQTAISASELNIDDSRNFEEGYFTPLQEGVDYTINKITGYISLNRALGSREVLAIAFNYRGANNEIVEVGEINSGGGDRIFLKMLRPKNVSTDNSLFPLTMRNIYSLGVSNITRESLELELQFTEDNVASNRLPGRGSTMLQDLGLDRVDTQGALQPDNQIDIGTGTLDPQNGLIIFPYLQPFGDRIREVLQDSPASQADVDRLAYDELYTERQRNAAQSSKNSFYQFDGTSRGGVQENFNLGIALVEGSVRVYANGTELQENIDYQVDYSFGSITILNERYTAPGQDIRIEYENQSLTSIEQKTFTGFRAEYGFTDNITIGGTYFRFSERPLDDKIRLGDEPINNAVIGFDANAEFDAQFITRFLDNLPVLQTREPSAISFSGEFAQLRPGVAETRAVSQAIRNNELFEDEENGLAFIDDFEGANIKISLLNATRWNLASAPAAIPGYDADAPFFEEDDFPGMPVSSTESRRERSDLRSQFSWYTIPRNIASILDGVEFTAESEPVEVTDVFPGRETQNPQEEIINTLDVFYDPTTRGPYNYNDNLRTILDNESERTWGGMTAVIPAGQEDFSQNNIEFLEFWVQPVLPNGQMPGGAAIEEYDGKIFIDIGLVTEDVVPNTKLNTEDGLALNPETLILDNPSNPRSAIPANPPPPEGQFSNANRDLEDVGLDGLPNTEGVNNLNEQTVFEEFISQMREQFGANSQEFQDIISDPSNDDYVFYGQESVQDLPLHERFHRLLGYYDGNTPIDQDDKRAITNRPNTEGLVNPSTVSLTDAYFQYEVDLNPADQANLEIGTPGSFITDRVPGSRQQDRWYQVRIPLSEFERKIGDINDFQNITYIRIWMSGYEQPFTLRFATLEFVGSQWRQDEEINQQSDPSAQMRISSLNIEENSNRRPIPYRQPEGAIRAENRASQLQSLQNEQSIVMDVNNLSPGATQLIRRVYPGGLDLLNYSNMRMFVHGEGYDNREDAELVMRFGNDLENNYYEYRQPVTPSDPNFPYQPFEPADNAQLEEEAEQVWLYEENSMNIVLSAFNQLKQLRDQEEGSSFSEVYERSDILENAVPGAVVAIKGNPSLGRVTEVGMGIKNPFDPANPSGNGTPVLDAQMWLNELRVSGFDNEKGWAANAKSTIKLADFATVNANLTRQTQGFGSLDSRLGQRRVSNEFAYDVNTSVNLDSFIPERFGWSIPVNLSTRRSTSTPKYLPNQGDIRFSDFEDAVNARADIDTNQKNRLIDQQKEEIETFSETYAINFSNVSKTNSQSELGRLLLDNTTLNYVYNTTDSRSPQYLFQDNWNFNGSLRYALTLRNVRFIRPFNLFQDIPLLSVLAGLQLGYMPTNLTASIGTERTYEERKRRILQNEVEQPLQQTHNFNYSTIAGFGYNLTRSISTSFQSQTVYDLTRVATEQADFAGIDSTAFEPLPSMEVFGDLITGDKSARRNTYNENYTASWQPRFNQIQFLDWLSYNSRYSGGFRWENSPFGSDLGARVSNNFRLDNTLRVDTENLLNRLPFYQNAVEADEEGRQLRRTESSEADTTSIGFGEQVAYYGRKAALAAFSLESVDITYNDSKTSAQSGYSGSSQFFDMFGSESVAPTLGYRLGLFESIGQGDLISNPNGMSAIQLPSSNTYTDNVTVTARLNPFQNVSVDLNWQTQWDRRRSESLSLNPQNEFSSVLSASGNIASSVWAFGPGYGELFRSQLETAFDGIVDSENIIRDPAGGNNTLLNPVDLQRDFRSAYMSNSKSIGDKNFTAFPLPTWRINWTGIENWIPFLGNIMQRATLTHAYEGLYRIGWNLNNNPGELITRRVGIYTVEDERPEYEPTTVNIEKRFSPLVQLNITWDNGLRSQLGYETSNITSLSLANSQIIERVSKGLRVSLAYTIRNFRIPFVRRTASNVDLTFNGSLIEDTEQRFLLDANLDAALQESAGTINRDPDNYSFTPGAINGQSRINASAVVGYRFSNTIQANFEYAFSQILPKSTRTFKRTTHDIRFSIRINIRST